MASDRPERAWLSISMAVACALLAACAEPSKRSAQPQATRTLSSTGFVDNGGRTSDERSRTEFSGMRPTEMGGDNPVGTPGSGLPLPIEPKTSERASKEAPRNSDLDSNRTGTVLDAALESMSRAYCERERRCARLRAAETPSCLKDSAGRFKPALNRANCSLSFDSAKVVECTSSLRDAACDVALESLSRTEACNASAMCLSR